MAEFSAHTQNVVRLRLRMRPYLDIVRGVVEIGGDFSIVRATTDPHFAYSGDAAGTLVGAANITAEAIWSFRSDANPLLCCVSSLG